MKKFIVAALGLLCTLGAAAQQSWPDKPVRLIVPFAPGGTTDIAARLLGERLSQAWKQPVLIENRSGAGGSLGAAEAARAAPDGYTLLFPSGSVMTVNQHVYQSLGYDPIKDFVPITSVVSGAQVIVVSAKGPYKDIRGLIEAARTQPGKVTFGHAGIATQTHLAGENLLYQAKVEAVQVPFKGEAPAMASLIAGDIDFVPANIAAALPHIQSGRLRALGVTSPAEAPQLPGVPPVAVALPGFENVGWWGLVAPAGTPSAVITKVYTDTKKALEATELKERLFAQGLMTVGNTPQEFANTIREETALWAKIVKERKISVK
jgi:tripartite-type tricarboxylate transporter receptor subunit TctC